MYELLILINDGLALIAIGGSMTTISAGEACIMLSICFSSYNKLEKPKGET